MIYDIQLDPERLIPHEPYEQSKSGLSASWIAEYDIPTSVGLNGSGLDILNADSLISSLTFDYRQNDEDCIGAGQIYRDSHLSIFAVEYQHSRRIVRLECIPSISLSDFPRLAVAIDQNATHVGHRLNHKYNRQMIAAILRNWSTITSD